MYSLDDIHEAQQERAQENARRTCADELRDAELFRQLAGPVEGLCCDIHALLTKLQGSGLAVMERHAIISATGKVLAMALGGEGWTEHEREEVEPSLEETIAAIPAATEREVVTVTE
jgi:hypothetical protein